MNISEPYEHKGLEFYDLPGSSTEKFPKESYVENMNIQNFDCVIFVTSDRFFEDDLYLIKQIQKISVPIYLVRTKIDLSVSSGLKRDVSEKDTLQKIKANIVDNLQGCECKGIYLTSAEHPYKYELNKLLSDIAKNLSEFKKQRFIADIAITSKDLLNQKEKLADKIATKYAALSAANALNPIPGVDIAVDVSILIKMAKDIIDIFGLNNDSISYLSSMTTSSQLKIVLGKAGQIALKYATKEAIFILLKRLSLTIATKEFGKYVPIFGQIFAAGLGFKVTRSLGSDIIMDCKKMAGEIFESFADSETI